MKKTWDEEKQETLEQLDFETEHADLDDSEYFQAKRSWLVRKSIWKSLLLDISNDTLSEFKLTELQDRPYTLLVSGLKTPFKLLYTKDHELMAYFEKENENWDCVVVVDSPKKINFKTAEDIELTYSDTFESINSSDFYTKYIKQPLETWLKSIQEKEIHFCHSGKGVTWVEFK